MTDRAKPASDLLESSELRDLAALAQHMRRRAGEQPGMMVTDRVGRGFELQGLDPFRAGDDARAIDWRTRLRTGELWVRRHHTEGDAAVSIIIDNSASMTPAKRRCAARAAAAIAVVAGAADLSLAVFDFSSSHEVAARARLDDAALHRALVAIDRLARATTKRADSLPAALDRMRRRVHADEQVVVISDLADPAPVADLAAALARLARHVACIHVVDERERNLGDDVDELVCTETGAHRRVDDPDGFAARVEAWQEAIADRLRARSVTLVSMDAARPARLVDVASRVVVSWS
jgi:uncharacterized protein (DUF58 family)